MAPAYSDGRSLVVQPSQPMAIYHNRTVPSRNRGGSWRAHRIIAYAENASLVANSSDPRGRTQWYGNYTEEQYLAQRQSEERAKWAASVRSLTSDLDQSAWPSSPLHPPALLTGLTVVLLSPRKPVTVGTVARACGSFECEDLRIVMPRQQSYITRHAKSASKGAQYILYGAGMYDSIEQATSDCDIRIAFTRWSQASGAHVAKLDITTLTSHPAVQNLISQPLAATSPPHSTSRPASAPWSESAAMAAAEAEAKLVAAAAAPTSSAATVRPPAGPCNTSDDNHSRTSSGASSETSSRAVYEAVAATVCEGGCDEDGEGSGDSSSRQQGQEPSTRSHSGMVSNADMRSTCSTSSSTSAGHRRLGGGGAGAEAALRDYSGGVSTRAGAASMTSDVNLNGQTGAAATTAPVAAASPVAVVAPVAAAARPPKVALVFGREELGLSDDEVDGCEAVCCVPMGRLQESLSLSHAVSIALCAIYQARLQHLASAGASVGMKTARTGATHLHST